MTFLQSPSSARAAPDFADYLSFRDFAAMASAFDYGAGFDQPHVRNETKHRDELLSTLMSAVAGFLVDLRDGGHLSPIADIDDRGLRWPDAWNAFVGGEAPPPAGVFLQPFMSTIMPGFISTLQGRTSREPAQAYAALVAAMNSGELDICHKLDTACALSGVQPVLQMGAGWRLAAYKELRGFRISEPRVYEPIGPVPPVEMIELRIPAPSGRIIVTDWPRLDGGVFSEIAMRGAPPDPLTASNGTMVRSQFYAGQLGLLSVYTGEEPVSLIREGEHFVLGAVDPEHPVNGPDYKSVVSRIQDETSWASFIDVQVFEDLLKAELGQEEGAKAAASYLCGRGHKILEVEPGELFLYFPSRFSRMVELECVSEEVSLQWFSEMTAVLADHPMEWRNWSEAEAQPVRERSCAA